VFENCVTNINYALSVDPYFFPNSCHLVFVMMLYHTTMKQLRRNEFESKGTGSAQKWGHRSVAKRRKYFSSCPSTFWL